MCGIKVLRHYLMRGEQNDLEYNENIIVNRFLATSSSTTPNTVISANCTTHTHAYSLIDLQRFSSHALLVPPFFNALLTLRFSYSTVRTNYGIWCTDVS